MSVAFGHVLNDTIVRAVIKLTSKFSGQENPLAQTTNKSLSTERSCSSHLHLWATCGTVQYVAEVDRQRPHEHVNDDNKRRDGLVADPQTRISTLR